MIVGLTGGIGSGKTTVGRIFAQLGVPLFVADEEAKRLLDEDVDLQRGLVDLLGPRLLNAQGQVDRAFMAAMIFKDEALLQKVNALVHPAVGRRFVQWYQAQKAPYVLREAAILFESGSHRDCAKVIVVSAPESLRLSRSMARSGESEAAIRARMDRQMPAAEKEALADYLIYNDGRSSLIKQILPLHENLLRLANTRR